MPTIYQTHVKTILPVRLGYSNLYEPRAFKAQKETDDNKPQAAPKYSLNALMDKMKDAKNIKRFTAAQQAAIQRAVDRGNWSKRMVNSASLSFRDCDEYEISVKVGTEDKVMTLAEQNPKKEGKYELRASSKANARPQVYYMDKKGKIIPMPKPITDPDPDDPRAMAEADRIHVFWDEQVYAGQNALVSVTFGTWNTPAGNGVRASIDWVLIVGGGTPEGQVEFKDDFNEDDMSQLLAWRNANAASTPSFSFEDEDTVDETTGEVVDEPKPRKRKPVDDEDEEETPAPRRRTRKPVEVDEDEADDEEPVTPRRRKAQPVELDDDEEETPVVKRRSRRPVVEEEEDFDEPDVF
ncbi:ssDNA-binding protein [Bifidobacterium callitrichidarum]|uniref:DUF2815 domain-containing protein n=1 Tax=Bifidobacterium callitrichidarum TaxID=2052941 RepID=A0A2U2N9B9_9BIFI|nr:ssDNA-binding protein [Bifidobacterium callitrichidarum]PWG65683.1 hypothetical protein DF196_07045 [Bifidobacterium callitrichidarum]